MKNPLNKRYFRELKNDFGKYIALCLFLIVTIGFCSGFLVADGSTPVLQREEPVGVQQRVEQAVDRGDRFGRYQSAAQQLSREVLGGTLHLVEVESDVLAQIGIGARDVDFGHAQADGRATLLRRGLLLELGCFHRGVFRERHGDRFVERERTLGLLRRQPDDGRKCRRRKEGSDCYFHINQCVYGANI